MAAPRGVARLVRVAALLAVLGYGGWYAYDELLQPDEIKRRVHDEIAAKLDGVDVEIGSARLRPFLGGVNVSDIKLIRRDDPTRTPFAHIEKAIVWHDKSAFPTALKPAKIELDGVHLRAIRDDAGKWNLQGITKPSSGGGDPLPVIVVKNAHVELIDRKLGSTPVLDVKELEATLVNDPATVLTFEVKGTADGVGPFAAKGKHDKETGAAGSFDLGDLKIGPDLARLIGLVAPEAVEHLRTTTGSASCRTRWAWRPGRVPPIAYDSEFELRDGSSAHPNLPGKLDQLRLKARVRDGDLTVEHLTGKLGDSGIDVKLEIDAPKHDPKQPAVFLSIADIEERVRRVEVTLTDLAVGPALFDLLPPSFAEARTMFNPAGACDLTFEQRRENGVRTKQAVFRPKGMSATYEGFKYPADAIRGTVTATLGEDAPRFEIDLVGEANGKPVTLKGRIRGGEDRETDLVLTGSDIVLDAALTDALPDDLPRMIKRLKATATGDFTAKLRTNARIRREHGPGVMDNEFDIKIRTGTMLYEGFDYPLRQIAGNLYIRTVPDTPTIEHGRRRENVGILEFRDFSAIGSGGCKLKVKGNKRPEPGGTVMQMEVKGIGVPLDGELSRAMATLKMDKSWATFDPSGRMNCEINVRLHDRNGPAGELPFNPNRDLEMGLAFNGPSIRPTFFSYLLSETKGQIAFAKGEVDIQQFSARHGATTIQISRGNVKLPPEGGYWADLRDVKVSPLIFDRELTAALPRGLKSAVVGLSPKGGIGVHAKQLVVSSKAEPAAPLPPGTLVRASSATPAKEPLPVVYWDATVYLKDASLDTGVPWDGLHGELSTRGLYMGDRLGRIVANLAVEKGRILKQPFELLSARFEVDPAKPDFVSVPWINAKIYGGEIGGQARLELASPVRFDLSLNGSRMKLEELARANNMGPGTELKGLVAAQLSLSNPIDPATQKPLLQGSGSIDIPNGRMLNIPSTLEVIKLARLQKMDETLFEEAHAVFRIRGNRVRVGQLDLLGNAISLGGDGEMNLDGSNAQFEFYTVWTNIRNLLGGGGDLAARISGNLFRIRVTGDLGGDKSPKVEAQALPGLTDPIRRLMGRAEKR